MLYWILGALGAVAVLVLGISFLCYLKAFYMPPRKPKPEGQMDFPEGEMYILGEYCDDMLGKYINLYYGSFAALAEQEDWDEAVWKDELWITLSHELTHHMEARGGLHALDDRDAEELAAWKAEFEAMKEP